MGDQINAYYKYDTSNLSQVEEEYDGFLNAPQLTQLPLATELGKVLAALRIDDMPRNIRIALFSGFHDGFSCGEAHRRQQEHDKCSDDMFFHWMIRI